MKEIDKFNEIFNNFSEELNLNEDQKKIAIEILFLILSDSRFTDIIKEK